MDTPLGIAKSEIHESLKFSLFATHCLGVSFTPPTNKLIRILKNAVFFTSVSFVILHASSDAVNIGLTPFTVENIVPLLHTQCYAILSAVKATVLWYKKTVFQKLLTELAEIWPVPPLAVENQRIKDKNLSTLRRVHIWYFVVNLVGVWVYNLTPICKHYYRRYNGEESHIGTIWSSWYPFDKTQPIPHFFVYLFEILMGQVCVWITLSTDLLFSGMASHIVLLLRFLQSQLKSLTVSYKTEDKYYQEVVNCIKLHQRLIRYCFDIGEAFSFVNLVNVVLSSINMCCVAFTILVLDPFLAISNKLFFVSALLQVGILCWYGQNIILANSNISTAAYNSEWYEMTPRCRRALLLMIQRTQKPIGFTAMNFTYISLSTYAAIMIRAYSYFTLLYTLYDKNKG